SSAAYQSSSSLLLELKPIFHDLNNYEFHRIGGGFKLPMSRRERQRYESPDSYTPPSSPDSDIEEGNDINPLRMEPPKEAWADIEVRNATSKYSDFNSALACITNLSHPATRKLFDIRPCYEGDASACRLLTSNVRFLIRSTLHQPNYIQIVGALLGHSKSYAVV
ncbi:hypothetical protein L195_g045921, partial [Trifolium pratense]